MFKKKKQSEDVQTEMTGKKKKKFKKRYIAIGVVALLIVFSVVNSQMAGSVPMPVIVKNVEKGEITQTLDISGIVESEEVKSYFAEVNGQVQTVNAKLGTSVKAGENLLLYNVEKMERDVKLAELEAKATGYGIDASVETMNASQQKAAKAAKDYEDAVKYVNHYSGCVSSIKDDLVKASQASAQVQSLTQELATQQEKLKAKPNSEKLQKKVKDLEKELKAATKEAEKYDVTALQASLETCSADLAAYESLKAQYEAAKETDPSYNSQLAQQNTLKQVNNMQKEKSGEGLTLARGGVNADFDGIITEVSVVDGQSVVEGTPLFTVANEKQVKVTISVSKYDLAKIALNQEAKITINNQEYEGYVAKIDRFAQPNASGATVLNADIHINNPDENIYLGIEGRVSITTAELQDVLVIPMECINADTEGDFCYVVEDGVIVRKNVEIGISSDEYSQVLNGLKEGDQVVSQVTTGIEEGMKVTPMEDTEMMEDGAAETDATAATNDSVTTDDAATAGETTETDDAAVSTDSGEDEESEKQNEEEQTDRQ